MDFLQRKRSWRRDRFVAERWRIKQDLSLGGVFSTHVVMPGTPEWDDLCLRHSDMEQQAIHTEAHFVSRLHAREGWIYHANFFTVDLDVICRLTDWVEDETERRLVNMGVAPETLDPHYDQEAARYVRPVTSDGITSDGVRFEVYQELLHNPEAWPAGQAGWRPCAHKCVSGIDVDCILPVSGWDTTRVALAIEHFWDSGERFEMRPVCLTEKQQACVRGEIEASMERFEKNAADARAEAEKRKK